MSSSQGRSDRLHQDFIAPTRYSNKLPPPPNPPKLLHIPGTGLRDGHYTEGSYASRLVREQPINIEIDSELGMPINLIGLPGVFDGDERCIQGMEEIPTPHPNDRPLLKPLSALGKAASASGVSFLRRTEYMVSNQNSRTEITGARNPARPKSNTQKRRHDDISQDEPARIVRDIESGFTLANDIDAQTNGDAAVNNAKSAWANPKHPTKPHLKLLDAYPVLPDLDATPDTGTYSVIKYRTNPVASTKKYDERLDIAVLRPRDPRPEIEARWRQEQAERAEKGEPETELPYDYDLFLAADEDVAEKAQKSIESPDEHADESFEFARIRLYETQTQQHNKDDPFDHNIAVALFDNDDQEDVQQNHKRRKLEKGAYFYPVGANIIIQPARGGWGATATEGVVDMLDVSYREPDAAEIDMRNEQNTRYEAPLTEAAG